MPAHRGTKPETNRTPLKITAMAEAAFITPTAEMMPITSGAPVAAASAASRGIFAGMLAQRLQPPAESLTKGSAVDTAVRSPVSAASLPAGQSSPQDGNVLPLEAPIPAIFDTGPETLSVMLEALPDAGSDGMPLVTARPDVLVQDLPLAGVVPDVLAPLPAGVIPPLAAPLEAKLQPLPGERPVPADERRTQPDRVPSPAALKLASLIDTQPVAMLERPASLGLNARGETAGMLRAGIPLLSAEQAARGGIAAQLTNQTLAGDLLSRQFQQQIDRLLATSRSPTGAGLSAPILVSSDTPAGITPPDLSSTAFLPGIGSDVRAAALTGSGSLPGLPVNIPVGHPGWSAELGQRMVWLANQEIREAQIQLNPRNLGPIDVRIIYSDTQQLSVSFNAQNPAAREALDAALPRLREMFEQQGLNLADASVSQESFAGQQRDAEDENGLRHDAAADTHWVDSGDEEPQQQSPPVLIGLGLVDIFA